MVMIDDLQYYLMHHQILFVRVDNVDMMETINIDLKQELLQQLEMSKPVDKRGKNLSLVTGLMSRMSLSPASQERQTVSSII